MSTYSTNLRLELPSTGGSSGTWGTVTNNNLGTLLEQAVSGYVTQAVTAGTTTITIPDGATGVARNMFIELTGTGGGVLEVPTNKKLYFIYNHTGGGLPVTVKVSGQTGVSVPDGYKVALVCNGTDVVSAITLANTSLITTNFSILESGGKLVFKYGSTTIASLDSSGNLTTLAAQTAGGTP